MKTFFLNKKLPYYAIAFSITLCSIMGIWWLYLLAKLGHTIQVIAPNHLLSNNLYHMIIAEGSTFFILLIFVLIIIFFLVKNDKSKMFAMQKFYAIFSHELKTPLTTLQLQIEILPEVLNKSVIDRDRLNKTLTRLVAASEQLKNEVHTMLTLSQLELSQKLETQTIDLKKILENWIETKKSSHYKINLNMDESTSFTILGNAQALTTILNNLFNNTKSHNSQAPEINLKLSYTNQKWIEFSYTDHGIIAPEMIGKLGNLFFKSSNSLGSGLGLYIIEQMMKHMHGKSQFINNSQMLTTKLIFKRDNH